MNSNRNELMKVNEFITKLTAKANQLVFSKETYNNLVTEHNALKLLFEERKAKEKIVNEEDFKIWITDFHNQIREHFNLPNKL